MIEDELEHLKWIYERMQYVHKEDPRVDYMIKFKKILQKLDVALERK